MSFLLSFVNVMFICSALPVIQLLHATPGSHKSFQSLATTVLFSAISVCLVMLCFQTNNFDDDEINLKLNQVQMQHVRNTH